ncbi:MAG: shikimate kinase [Fimbriiglobus sp.]
MARPPRILLVGYRGTGKTTVGRLIAARLGWSFADADEHVEQTAGNNIAGIFAVEGETGFRDRESAALAELCRRPEVVIATGGGAVLRPANRELLAASGFVVWLTAPADAVWKRMVEDPTTAGRRPNLTAAGGRSEVETLLAAREPLYRSVAAAEVSTADRSPDAVVADIFLSWEAWAGTSPATPSPG